MTKKQIIVGLIALIFASGISFAQKCPGYIFYSPKGTSTAYLIDTNGTTYHSWNFAGGGKTGYSAYVAPGGSVIRTVTTTNQLTGGGITGKVQKSDYEGNLVWDFTYSSSTYCLHHDICPMPNGNVLMISYDVKTAAEASAAGCSKSMIIWCDKIIEVKPTGLNTGEIVWEWKFWDHLCQSVASTKANYVEKVADHPELLNLNYKTTQDWIHANGLDYNEELDQIVVSSHMLNEFYVIDHSTTTAEAAGHSGGKYGKGGDFLFRWGNPASFGVTGSANFNIIHDAHWVPAGYPKANYLVGFNNSGISSSKSCVDAINPPYKGDVYEFNPATYSPSSYTYRHACNGHTNNEGNSQFLPNGNLLVCIAQAGLIYEVDPSNKILFQKTITGSGQPGGSIAQTFKYSQCYINGSIAPKPTITRTGNKLIASEAQKYQWLYYGEPINDAVLQYYDVTKNGKYQLQIIDANGCESYVSAPLLIEDITAVEDEFAVSGLYLYPNPSTGSFNLSSLALSKNPVSIEVFDATSNKLKELSATSALDLSDLNPAIYYVKISFADNTTAFDKIMIIK